MFLRFEENPNIGFTDDRVFQERSTPMTVSQVLRRKNGQDIWCAVIGLDGDSKPIPALARKVDDSGEGTCYLVYGGVWGLRLAAIPEGREAKGEGNVKWSLDDPKQWGEPFLLLPSDGADIRFA